MIIKQSSDVGGQVATRMSAMQWRVTKSFLPLLKLDFREILYAVTLFTA